MAITKDDRAPSTRRGAGGTFGTTPTRNVANVSSRDTISYAPSTISSADRQYGAVIPGGGGSSYGGSDYGSGTYSGYSAPPPPPPPPSEEDYLAGDAGYQAQLAALLKALDLFKADDTAQRTRYETDYGEALKNLGWTPDDPNTADINEAAWNWEDMNTASGRAYQGQLNDFASRGMLQSSGYARANNDLQRSFNDQLGSVDRARTDFISQRDRDLAAYQNENTSSSQQARAEALARRAAMYGL